jgi:hypothetical protein
MPSSNSVAQTIRRTKVNNAQTLKVLKNQLSHARGTRPRPSIREPYHVVHFDTPGLYDRHVGLSGLCFEDPRDVDKLDNRRHITVPSAQLGKLLRDRIPLVFLEVVGESPAPDLLKAGVGSVVAMSHTVLVETASLFVEAFYEALARGSRVGDAMLEGRRKLRDDPFRGRIFGAGDWRLEDWFVPVLFQERRTLSSSLPLPPGIRGKT